MTPLRERMLGDLRLRNFADTSIESYIRAVRQYAEFFGRSPKELTSEDLRKYLLYLREEKKVAQGTYNQALAAIRNGAAIDSHLGGSKKGSADLKRVLGP